MGIKTWLGLKRPYRKYWYDRREVAAAPVSARLREPNKWTEFAHLRFINQFRDMPWLNKRQMRELIDACGLRTPAIYRRFVGADELDFSGLPDAFVLKPIGMSTKRGVLLLRRMEDGAYWEFFRGGRMTFEEARAEESEWEALWKQDKTAPFELVAEEFVLGEDGQGPIPYDYKLYTFHGEVRFIQQIDRNVSPRTDAFWINEFEPFEYETRLKSAWKTSARGEPRLPHCHREMIAAAKAISLELRTGFVRVDMYATPEGPVIGELTKVPGAPYFAKRWAFLPAFDKELGSAWAAANSQLGIEPPLIDDNVPLVRKRTHTPLELPSKRSNGG